MTSDSSAKRPKLNQRLKAAPAGAVLTTAWLRQQGISTRLADYYARSGWLHRIGDGAFTLHPESPSWLGAVFGLQEKAKAFHPGGRTALELSGYAHFLPLGDNYPVYLFSRAHDRLPAWLNGLSLASRVRHIRTDFLPADAGWREHHEATFRVIISAPERAALEFLHQLTPDAAAYEHANLVFEGLGTLRSDVVQFLLESCTSIKVKRLFLHLAERHGHAWFKQLDVSQVDLGSGKRALFPGGRLDPKYLITVPSVAEASDDAP